MRRISLIASLILAVSTPAWAQARDGAHEQTAYVVLPEAEEIALARSAAPAEVSEAADVWVLRNGRYEIARQGTNGNACMVSRNAAMSETFLEDSGRTPMQEIAGSR